jgi:hypothetical protein
MLKYGPLIPAGCSSGYAMSKLLQKFSSCTAAEAPAGALAAFAPRIMPFAQAAAVTGATRGA